MIISTIFCQQWWFIYLRTFPGQFLQQAADQPGLLWLHLHSLHHVWLHCCKRLIIIIIVIINIINIIIINTWYMPRGGRGGGKPKSYQCWLRGRGRPGTPDFGWHNIWTAPFIRKYTNLVDYLTLCMSLTRQIPEMSNCPLHHIPLTHYGH